MLGTAAPVRHLSWAAGQLEAAVAAGAARFSPEQHQQPRRLSFQIHGQAGPSSYRFGHDTGTG